NYEEALAACEALGNKLTAADCMAGIGLSLRAIGLWKEAIRFIAGARKTYEREKDKRGVAFSLWAEAGALRVAGNIAKAIGKFKESKSIFAHSKDKSGVAYALCGLGGTHRIAGKFKESMDYYREANEIFKGLKDKFGAAYSHCGIGNAFRMTDNYADAVKHFNRAAALYEEIGDIVSYSYTLWSLANVYKIKRDFVNAREHIKNALRNFKKTKDPRGIIYCDLTQGEMEFMEGRGKAAVKSFLSALANAEKHGFKLETCHSMMLLTAVSSQQSVVKTACYKKIGVNLNFKGIPFNMP
ncbi:MAG: tetratricopeptide repeat protein, partial [Nitrospirae bacterium]|nr:tetratricopeptide repeat protein [Nitrospirota bacterium]